MVYIIRKALALTLALGFALCSHLRPSCDFTVAGQHIAAGCTPKAAKAAQTAAMAAAEEILPGKASPLDFKRHVHFSFCPAMDSAPLLCDGLLRAQPGVLAGSCVYVEGLRLGVVADSKSFQSQFAKYIDNTLPTWASSGSVRGLELIPRYTRAEFEVGNDDMIMLVTGLSPVMYTDGKGRVSPV